jgi:hypothetical protein
MKHERKTQTADLPEERREMSCCREATAPLTDRHRMKVRYGGGRPVLIKGPVTGGLSLRESSGCSSWILDAIALVRNPLFRVEAVVELIHADGVLARREGSTGGGSTMGKPCAGLLTRRCMARR